MTASDTLAQGNHAFRWQQAAWGDVLVCEPLLEVARHAFTTRRFGLGPAPSELQRGYEALAAHLRLAADRVHDARQVHGTDVYSAPRGPRSPDRPAADILVTDDPDMAVVVRVADCVPILLADRRTRAVGAVHAGWRGTCAGAAMIAVRALHDRFGSRPADLVAAIGPSIGPCCYQVGPDVRASFAARDGELPSAEAWFRRDVSNRWRLDLWAANRDQLVAGGLAPGAVHLANECTASSLDRYYSYRAEGASAGRLLAAIRPGRIRR